MTTHSHAAGALVSSGALEPRLPTSDARSRRFGLIILVVAVGGFTLWATTAELAVAVVAPGSVTVESSTKSVQHFEGGIVKSILVEDGDTVSAGDPLIVLDDTQPLAKLSIAESEYRIALASEVRLLAEQSDRETLTFPDVLLNDTSARVQAVVDVQRRLFQVRRQSLADALSSLDEKARQMQEQIDGLERLQKVNRSKISSLSGEASDYRTLFNEGLGDNQRLRELERQSLQFQGENAQHSAEVAQLRSQISQNTLEKQIQLQKYHQEVGEDLKDVQAQVTDAQERMTALKDQVQRTQIVAPVSGTVVGLQVHTRGAVIRSGDTVMEIVPSNDGFIVEARVADRDIDNVHAGQPAEIRFSAFNQRLSNVIEGEVVHVSADSFEDEATHAHYYKARVKVTDVGHNEMTSSMQLLAGMPAEVMLQTGERTFASYLFKPFSDMLARSMREE
ncbi:HlyD family type I secretion periplasmic adaptor subunit [Salinicola rhizosphaerae]|uniref:Membrane fusion protein (MFP) family protein n=1 Tax=Salinicola rhizosphaerae TaxID=1443141 RepID=A0ABQ3DPA2_9GAMM|nr:HlyD family type I secretion periplasmic adaptor subunit [Salinicola rhizosphaerae]GHB07191.1 HlyD family type I secretion periplasmic adaptor subunit [Salinicola rhizosphaerae]